MMCRRMRRCKDGGEGESMANRKQSVLRVKGQSPECVNTVTVGTDQSQCHGSIDQMWAHAHSVLSDTHTIQYSFTHSFSSLSSEFML